MKRARDHEALRAEAEREGIAPVGSGRRDPDWLLPLDFDDDGMPNNWETAWGLNPADPTDAWLDPDGDHVVNLFECQLIAYPNDPGSPPVVTVGAEGADYADLATAIQEASPGTCIRVAEGTYRVNYFSFSAPVIMIQGGWSHDFAELDLKTHRTVLDGGMEEEILYFSVRSGEPTIILDGLNFVGGAGSFGAVNLLASGDCLVRTSLSNCSIADSESTPTQYGAVLSMNNWDQSGSDRTIANTLIAGNGSSGIYAQVTEEAKARWRILNSTIADNHKTGVDNGYGVTAFTLDAARLDVRVANSIIWGNENGDFSFRRNIALAANYSDLGNVVADSGAVYAPGPGLINAFPAFVDPANGDYHLSGLSPCVDAGAAAVGLSADFEGDPRGAPSTVDMGADEIYPPPPPLPSPPLMGAVSDEGAGTISFAWDDPNTDQTQFIAWAWDVYRAGWVEGGWNNSLWHLFPPAARSGNMALGYSGAYHLWLASQYPSGAWLTCPIPWTGIVYSGMAHTPAGFELESDGLTVRAHWRPEFHGTWHYQIIAYRDETGWIMITGPNGAAYWHYVAFPSVDFLGGAVDFTVPSPGKYTFFIRSVGWQEPYDPSEFVLQTVEVSE